MSFLIGFRFFEFVFFIVMFRRSFRGANFDFSVLIFNCGVFFFIVVKVIY